MLGVTTYPEPAPAPTMTAEEWYAADIAARTALAEATAARHADWLAECARVQARHEADIVARTAHAKAQADTAAAMLESVAAQRELAAAMATDSRPAWTRQALTLWFLARLPEVTGLTDLQRTDIAVKQADALLSRLPGP